MIKESTAAVPLVIALEAYERCGKTSLDLSKDLWDHLQNGFVFSTPWNLVLPRAVALDDGRHAWLVTVAVGSLKDLVSYCPFKLDWIAFERDGQPPLRVYSFDRFMHLAGKGKHL